MDLQALCSMDLCMKSLYRVMGNHCFGGFPQWGWFLPDVPLFGSGLVLTECHREF